MNGISSLIVSSVGSSMMLELLIVDVDDVFLVDEDVPEMPESADSFRVKYLPGKESVILRPGTMSKCR